MRCCNTMKNRQAQHATIKPHTKNMFQYVCQWHCNKLVVVILPQIGQTCHLSQNCYHERTIRIEATWKKLHFILFANTATSRFYLLLSQWSHSAQDEWFDHKLQPTSSVLPIKPLRESCDHGCWLHRCYNPSIFDAEMYDWRLEVKAGARKASAKEFANKSLSLLARSPQATDAWFVLVEYIYF